MKKKYLVITFFVMCSFLPGMFQSLAAEESWTIRTGLNFTPGLFYNQNWDPAYNGSAMTLSLQWQNEKLLLEAGTELG